ncbi:GNAT family N-acetyltransferase [uncultured Methanobrevibacter sp.]|uniref:GNAT family N-acetyltransferase n=1 Tax=uncultured Methanobrevibacter sp. TaxID=253161 RepID=UPI002600DA72|nr:GNAT family N-acetyltransferase [uncultured Methanobrevibacter sp.]
MIIRQFIENDLKRVHEIETMSFDSSYGVEMILKLFEIGSGFLVGEIDGYVVGYIIFWMKEENEGHIISLAIDQNYRNLGIGTSLLKKAILVFKGVGVDFVSLEVNANHDDSVRFYENFGFCIDRKVPHYYDNDDSAYIMFYKFK